MRVPNLPPVDPLAPRPEEAWVAGWRDKHEGRPFSAVYEASPLAWQLYYEYGRLAAAVGGPS